MADMMKNTLDVQIEGVVTIAGDYYAKTPEALVQLLTFLKEKGYELKDLRQDKRNLEEGITSEELEKSGRTLWYGRFTDLRRGKCKSCGSYISRYGIQAHGHKCEVCGEVTYLDIIDGSIVRFEFNSDKYSHVIFAPQLTMKTKRWDIEEGYLYLYEEPLEGSSIGNLTGEEAWLYLSENAHLWEPVKEDGQCLIRVKYPERWSHQEAAINVHDIYGHYWNHSVVKLWNGKECGEWDKLPVPESFNIFEAWHWAPLVPTPRLHERLLHAIYQVPDKGYYYQDGRPAFNDYHWREIGKFIRHFTTLNADAYDQAWHRFRNSGPGGIDDLARFRHVAPQVQNQPNIGNALVAAGKILEGQIPTPEEMEASEAGDREFVRLLGFPSPRTKTLDVGKYRVSVTYNAKEQIIRVLVTQKKRFSRKRDTVLDNTLGVPLALNDLPTPRFIESGRFDPDALTQAIFRLVREINSEEVKKGNQAIFK